MCVEHINVKIWEFKVARDTLTQDKEEDFAQDKSNFTHEKDINLLKNKIISLKAKLIIS